MSRSARQLPWDWYEGEIPKNVAVDSTAYIETSYSFRFFRSEVPGGVEYGRGASTYLGTMFDVGPRGRVKLGDYALVHGARIICDNEILIGNHALISWNVVLMDTYRLPANSAGRRHELELMPQRELRIAAADVPARPIHIGPNVWIGFETCVLPGVTIGEGSVIGARSVVTTNVPPFTIAAGNPARIVRPLTAEEMKSHAA
ncbi:MAG TPA: acyltransferase [Candidatus Binatia bacterium]|nr:acyltransferase [Candidatus Binatia bacterium]